MTFPTIAAPIVHLVLAQLLPLLLPATGQDAGAARELAIGLLAPYAPETAEELHLAAEIASLHLTVLTTLADVAGDEVPLRDKLRARSGAVSLSRQGDRLQRMLTEMQERRRGSAAEPVLPPEIAPAPREVARAAVSGPGMKPGGQAWSRQHQLAQRIADNARKNQARHIPAAGTAQSVTPPAGPPGGLLHPGTSGPAPFLPHAAS